MSRRAGRCPVSDPPRGSRRRGHASAALVVARRWRRRRGQVHALANRASRVSGVGLDESQSDCLHATKLADHDPYPTRPTRVGEHLHLTAGARQHTALSDRANRAGHSVRGEEHDWRISVACVRRGSKRPGPGFELHAPAKGTMARCGRHFLRLDPQTLPPSSAAKIEARSPRGESANRFGNLEGRNLLLNPVEDAVGEGRMAVHHVDDGSSRRFLEQEGGGVYGWMPLAWDAERLRAVDGLDLGAPAGSSESERATAGSRESERRCGWLVPRVILQLGSVGDPR